MNLSKIQCPEFDTNTSSSTFVYLLDLLTLFCFIIHVYVMYCIVFRSTPQMKTYRWYLLYHQFVSCLGDFWINFLTKPVIFVPLPSGYLRGIAKNLMTPQIALAAGQFFVITACCTSFHLLLYRYFLVKNMHKDYIFPLWSKFLLIYQYFFPYLDFFLTATAPTNTAKTLSEWQEEYSCVTPAFMAIPNIWAYDKWECLKKTIVPTLYDTANFIITVSIFVHLSYKAIHIQIMSANYRRMQHQFLTHLVIQTSIPQIFVVFPAALLLFSVTFDWFTGIYLSDFIFTSLSLYGVSGGIVLIILIPSYHVPLCYKQKPQTITINTVSATNTSVLPQIANSSAYTPGRG